MGIVRRSIDRFGTPFADWDHSPKSATSSSSSATAARPRLITLGLSDVIQERSDGIELDTLFIDEGFGSLDPPPLDRAMQVLEVAKGPNGSFIRR